MGQQAMQEWQEVLDKDPNNLNAIDGIGSILYSMASTPSNPKKMEESKLTMKGTIQIKPSDRAVLLDRRD